MAKVYQVNPLVCTRCGQRMPIVAFLTDALPIRRILDHLGEHAEAEKSPPLREVLRIAKRGEGWGAAEWERIEPDVDRPRPSGVTCPRVLLGSGTMPEAHPSHRHARVQAQRSLPRRRLGRAPRRHADVGSNRLSFTGHARSRTHAGR